VEHQEKLSAQFIDISGRLTSGGETGLLGMAFHPNFPTDPRVYLSYTAPSPLRSRISEFTTPDGGLTLNPNSERIILTVNQPESNHNGGGIAFGPDGFLYLGLGDGGGGNDQHGTIGNGQLLTTLLGKFVRIDISGTTGAALYRIPSDNPFAANTSLCGTTGAGPQNCPEIYAMGFRNPWRWSFDRQTGQLWVGDVGQGRLEEIDRVAPGGNYGWRCFEGTLPVGLPCGAEQNLLPPIAEYGRTEGRSVTGGYVYRGAAIAGLNGRYVFGDFITGRIWHIAGNTAPTAQITGGLVSGLSISSFGEGVDGELYVVHYGGQLYRLTGS
jgi:glucose/arabinose dehydrogenase